MGEEVTVQYPKAEVLKEKSKVVKNNNCRKNDTCSLKQTKYQVRRYRISIDGEFSYGTRLNAWYETDSLATLEDYVFVQFVRGCQYEINLADKKPQPMFTWARLLYGKVVRWHFKKWTIDSVDTDPVYNSAEDEDRNRHDYYRFNDIPWSSAQDTEKLYGQAEPVYPILYVVDLPGTAFVWDNHLAENSSLEFKMCLYKSKDVPENVDMYNLKFAKPINCYDWSSSWIYNPKKGKFEDKGLVPVCK